jgi:hypothetical protein
MKSASGAERKSKAADGPLPVRLAKILKTGVGFHVPGSFPIVLPSGCVDQEAGAIRSNA